MGKTYKRGNDDADRLRSKKRKVRKLEKKYVKHLSDNIDEDDTYAELADGLEDFEKFYKPKHKR